jgi:PEP-CTERM motif
LRIRHLPGVVGWAVLAWATLAPSASASIIGHLVVGNCAAGQVFVSATIIDWQPNVSGFISCLQVGGGTDVTSVGDGHLVSPPAFDGKATINDLTVPSSGGEIGFMSFVNGTSPVNFHFDLTGLGPGSLVACTSSMVNGDSCSVPGSPFLLTKNNGGTSVSLSANGTILDTVGPISYWSGAFTTQINGQTPLDIQNIIATPGGTVASSFSGEFDISPAPEPITMVLIGGGLIALAAVKRRKLV